MRRGVRRDIAVFCALNALAGGGGPTPLPFSAIPANGWQAEWDSTPATEPLSTFTVTREGYDETGTVDEITETLTATRRVRLPYPSNASFSDNVALSDYIYSTDSIADVTNSSTVASPKPVAQWATPDRRVVGNSLTVDVVAFHRNGRSGSPVAAVVGRATDGTTTVTATSSTPIVLGHAGDKNAVIGYRLTFDLSTLTDNANITVNANVYPWIGAAASVLDSAATGISADGRGFGPQTYRRATALAAAPRYAYVNASTGNDGTAVTSTTAATAAASPFATVKGAVEKLRTDNGDCTGCIVRLQGTVALGSTSFAFANYVTSTTGGEMIIESDPDGATATLTWGTAISLGNLLYIRLRNLNLTRTASVTLPQGGSGTKWVLENITFDGGASTVALVSSNVSAQIMGMTVSNVGAGTSVFAPTSATNGIRMIRGMESATALTLEMFNVLGCSFTANAIRSQSLGRTPNGTIVAYNKFLNQTGASVPLSFGGGEVATLGLSAPATFTGIAVVQNVFEKPDTTNAAMFRPSGDSDAANIDHLICWNNTFAGFAGLGRGNLLYDENPSYARTHSLQSFRGNIHVQINTKSDLFLSDGTRVGNWPYNNGVGCIGELSLFTGATGPTDIQDFIGLKSERGTSTTTPLYPMADIWTAFAGPTDASTAGAGNGTYTLAASSPAIGILDAAEEALSHDIAGTARTRGSIGAYA